MLIRPTTKKAQVAEDHGAEDVEDDEDDDPDDNEQAWCQYLRSLTRMSQHASPPRHLQLTPAPAHWIPGPVAPSRPLLKVLPGHTIPVIVLSKDGR
jgi:hypothetical protein